MEDEMYPWEENPEPFDEYETIIVDVDPDEHSGCENCEFFNSMFCPL